MNGVSEWLGMGARIQIPAGYPVAVIYPVALWCNISRLFMEHKSFSLIAGFPVGSFEVLSQYRGCSRRFPAEL